MGIFSLFIVVFSATRAGAEHWAANFCEAFGFRDLLCNISKLAPLRTSLSNQILSAAPVPVNSQAHTLPE